MAATIDAVYRNLGWIVLAVGLCVSRCAASQASAFAKHKPHVKTQHLVVLRGDYPKSYLCTVDVYKKCL